MVVRRVLCSVRLAIETCRSVLNVSMKSLDFLNNTEVSIQFLSPNLKKKGLEIFSFSSQGQVTCKTLFSSTPKFS